MTVIYDNWERLVTATLRREQLRISGLRTPSDISLASASPSFNFSSQSPPISSFNFWSLLVGDSFTYHQILKATDFLSDSNLIKHGHSGDLYYGVLESGIQVVVKKINLLSIERELEFRSELEICGMVHHSRLIPFLGYCLENVHEKFLVYKYTPNKDLSCHLQREVVTGAEGNRRPPSLDWITRLKVAIGAAEGLCYLHHECFPPLVHRDIQASSILLDNDFEVRLGSLTEVCIHEKHDKQKSIARFLRLPKGIDQSTSGTSTASCAYDVYCFGKVLLELVSGKLGFSYINDSTMKDWIANTIRSVVPANKKLLAKFVDPSLLIEDDLLLEVWLVAFLAKACLSSKPSKRPEMTVILEALKYIKSARFSGHGNVHPASHPKSVSRAPMLTKVPEGSKLMEWILQLTANTASSDSSTSSGNNRFSDNIRSENDDLKGKILASPSLKIFTYSELKDATKNFRIEALLQEDEFGGVYKGLVKDKSKSNSGSESVVAVRKFDSHTGMQRSQDWESVVNLLGRLSHPNIIKLLGCCSENNVQLFVYEFMHRGCLDFHLFRRGSSVPPLSWDTRVKILTGAARGLNFLHALQRRGFFHQKNKREGFYDFFKPSNILLDDDYNAKISGFHVGRIDIPDIDCEAHPLKYSSGRYVYAGPEWFVTEEFSLKSDVYGFGIVLVQMLMGIDVHHPSFMRNGLLNFKQSRITTRTKLEKVMDPRLEGKYPSGPALELAKLAILCLRYEPEFRPSMKQVVDILQRIDSADEIPKEPHMNSTS